MFRLYAIATLVVLIGFGAAASFAIQGIEENRTPWAGGFERINAYAYFAWIVVLAVTVLRHSRNPTGNTAADEPVRETWPAEVARQLLTGGPREHPDISDQSGRVVPT